MRYKETSDHWFVQEVIKKSNILPAADVYYNSNPWATGKSHRENYENHAIYTY